MRPRFSNWQVSPGFHAVADIYLDGPALYPVHGTKPSACGTLRSTARGRGFQTGGFPWFSCRR